MTKDQKIIRAKVRLLELAKAARQSKPGLQDDGVIRATAFTVFKELYETGGELVLRQSAQRSGGVLQRVQRRSNDVSRFKGVTATTVPAGTSRSACSKPR